jgi:serine/threonine protein kinase
MGNCQCANATDVATEAVKPVDRVGTTHFKFMYCIGRGGFGKVWKVQYTKDQQYYAMKEMQKARIMSRRSLNSVMAERQFLTQLRHPFIVNMMYAFQDMDNIYLVSNLMTGGDLRFHIGKRINFDEAQTKFIVACLTVSLQYIHENQIIHRDIKPENLVFDSNGYLKVTDFGIAKIFQRENSHETSGTPSYMAPEVIFKQNHSFESDYYALGVICHELMLSRRPYKGRTRKELKEQMLHKKIKLRNSHAPAGWDTLVVDFVNQCLQRKPCKRLGYNGATEIMQHPWLKNFNWQQLLAGKMKAPYLPNGNLDNFDERHANHERTLNATEQEEIYNKKILLRRDSIQHLFSGYHYDYQQGIKDKGARQQKSDIADKST